MHLLLEHLAAHIVSSAVAISCCIITERQTLTVAPTKKYISLGAIRKVNKVREVHSTLHCLPAIFCNCSCLPVGDHFFSWCCSNCEHVKWWESVCSSQESNSSHLHHSSSEHHSLCFVSFTSNSTSSPPFSVISFHIWCKILRRCHFVEDLNLPGRRPFPLQIFDFSTTSRLSKSCVGCESDLINC